MKKQIIKTNYDSCPQAIAIDIKCKYCPIVASWDKTLFNDTCRNGSVFTSVPPGGWWDVSTNFSFQRIILKEQDSILFHPWVDPISNSWGFSYINNKLDTISVFWLAFAKPWLLSVNTSDYKIKKNQFLP